MIILDANIVVSAIAGVFARQNLRELMQRGVSLAVPAPQLEEARIVLTQKLALPLAAERVRQLGSHLRILEPDTYASHEAAARARLHARAQADWPVLAAALAFDAAIWSNDRDFFGVGAPVWSSRNVRLAVEAGL